MRTANTEKPSAIRICIDIDGRFLSQFVGVCLDPFGRADQALFLGVPGAIDDRAFWLPTGFGEFADRTGLFHLGNHAADRIARSIDPRVMMVTANYPLIGPLAALHFGDHVVDRLHLPVEFELHSNGRGSAAEMICNGQSSAPRLGNHRAIEVFEQRQSVRIRDRQDGNLGQCLGIFTINALRIFRRTNALRQGVAGM